jgi:hypothetical protein
MKIMELHTSASKQLKKPTFLNENFVDFLNEFYKYGLPKYL